MLVYMVRATGRVLALAVISALVSLFTTGAWAGPPSPCSGLTAVGRVNSELGKPFTAEVYMTIPSGPAGSDRFEQRKMQKVARDSDGRLRIEDYSGDVVKPQQSRETTKVGRVFICDPVTQQTIWLNTEAKTANLGKLRAPTKADGRPAWIEPVIPSFCEAQLHAGASMFRQEPEDLGQRTIEGVEAMGVMERRTFLNVPNGGATLGIRGHITGSSGITNSSSSERQLWCSEELGTMVLLEVATPDEPKALHIAMTNILQVEPDKALFLIPADYKLVDWWTVFNGEAKSN